MVRVGVLVPLVAALLSACGGKPTPGYFDAGDGPLLASGDTVLQWEAHRDLYPDVDINYTYLTTWDMRTDSEPVRVTVRDAFLYPGPSLADDGGVWFPAAAVLYRYSAGLAAELLVPLGGAASTAPAVDADGTAYVGTADGAVTAISAEGAVLWTVATPGTPFNHLALGEDGALFGFSAVAPEPGETGWSAFALNADGTLRWSVPAGTPLASPALGRRGELLLVSNIAHPDVAVPTPEDFVLIALDPQTGERSWETVLGLPGYSPVVAPDGTVIVAVNSEVSQAGELLFLSGRTGHVQHRARRLGGWIGEPVVADDGDVYVGCADNLCVVTGAGRLRERWPLQAEERDDPGHTLVGPPLLLDGRVAAVRDDGWAMVWERVRGVGPERRSWARNGGNNRGSGRVERP